MTILLNIFFMYTSLTGKAQVVTSNMQLQAVLCGLSVALLLGCAYGGTTNREGKAISLFNLVKFDNDVCAGRSDCLFMYVAIDITGKVALQKIWFLICKKYRRNVKG